jgi:hypothetical protein
VILWGILLRGVIRGVLRGILWAILRGVLRWILRGILWGILWGILRGVPGGDPPGGLPWSPHPVGEWKNEIQVGRKVCVFSRVGAHSSHSMTACNWRVYYVLRGLTWVIGELGWTHVCGLLWSGPWPELLSQPAVEKRADHFLD